MPCPMPRTAAMIEQTNHTTANSSAAGIVISKPNPNVPIVKTIAIAAHAFQWVKMFTNT